jgi:dTMP kinase
LQREVEPQLARGRVVVSDRWYHSSLAYQGDPGSGLSIGRIRAPDLTIFLHVDPAIAARRRVAAGRALEMFDDEEIQRWVRDVPCTAWGYMSALGLVRERGERLVMLDGEASMGAVEANISRLINDLVLAAASGASA